MRTCMCVRVHTDRMLAKEQCHTTTLPLRLPHRHNVNTTDPPALLPCCPPALLPCCLCTLQLADLLRADALRVGAALAAGVPAADGLLLKVEIFGEGVCSRWHRDNYAGLCLSRAAAPRGRAAWAQAERAELAVERDRRIALGAGHARVRCS